MYTLNIEIQIIEETSLNSFKIVSKLRQSTEKTIMAASGIQLTQNNIIKVRFCALPQIQIFVPGGLFIMYSMNGLI